MKVEQLYTKCLAEAAYYIESEGEVAIIDPLREVDSYIDMAEESNSKIKYVFETHFHADFVSGHVDLANRTGATIVFGPTANTDYEAYTAKDNEEFKVGKLTVKVLHTPGHTPESSCFLLLDENGEQHCVFTGDTLFIGDVGRPDLAIKSDVTKEDLAGMLYDSLRNKIMPLGDGIMVYPGHGAGSACGKNLSTETYSTLGEQKENNYALQDITKEEFVKELTTGIMPPPNYFQSAALKNKTGYDTIDDVVSAGTKALSPNEAYDLQNAGALILDTRGKQAFHKGFIKESIFIGIDGGFAPWVGAVLPDNEQQIVILAEEGREEEVATRLARVGFDNTVGFINGGFDAWKSSDLPTDYIPSISAEELKRLMAEDDITVVDVRKPSEYEAEHACGIDNMPLDFILENVGEFDPDTKYFIHCRSGYRSLIHTSILKKNGVKNVVDIDGGFVAMKNAGIKMTEFECQSNN